MEEIANLDSVMVVVADERRLEFVAMAVDNGASVISQVLEPGKKTWVIDLAMEGVPMPLRGRRLRAEFLETHVRMTPIEL